MSNTQTTADFSDQIAAELPYLRRYARALTGAQSSGDRYAVATLETILQGRTALIIAHRLSTVAIADRVLVMADGNIVEDGTPEDLIAGEGRFAHLHEAWEDSLV